MVFCRRHEIIAGSLLLAFMLSSSWYSFDLGSSPAHPHLRQLTLTPRPTATTFGTTSSATSAAPSAAANDVQKISADKVKQRRERLLSAIQPPLWAQGRPTGIALHMGLPGQELGVIRLHLRPEWSNTSFKYGRAVAVVDPAQMHSTVYRLEPGFLIQGRLMSTGVPPNRC
jgi:hypothetical protein